MHSKVPGFTVGQFQVLMWSVALNQDDVMMNEVLQDARFSCRWILG